ncbi:hypothetical protein BO83DRAFT_386612 [Aspergillus eucalypticola CBS 122712]|uniref:2-haloalkanoic acid dehalogenase n=1 Tax=Aspergillus eucalypticola (strain CBS 122712 / IBT 29274) TaxID=1448314 RepID=A0A317W439_ASPEC|nr:uncharacterized protein BO83DRAFT_386612 [Aspergillus eucalypticola CBS 122712]PWY78930.1 hypothetical protein BO83DRAFT_386612 [Aspergillus eucalypticola CBS 122712]
MATTDKHVVFDVVGTCVSYDVFFSAIDSRLGPKLRTYNIHPRLFGYAWMEAGEKEYTYLSLSTHYVKFFDVFRSIFYRTLWQAGILNPREFATDEDREYLLASYREFKSLRNAGFTVWALTSGDTSRVAGYLAEGGVMFPEENFVSCDTIGVGGGSVAWFAAAHMWDAAAAKRCGFKGAWVSLWEKEKCSDIFGKMDVEEDSLPMLAEGIITATAAMETK